MCGVTIDSRVEAGSNTSTIDLRVVGGDEKGTQCLGYDWATLFLRHINTGPGPPGWESLESETLKYGHEVREGLGPENDCAGEDHQQLYIQTHAVIRENVT
jgi:hypothetical protein